MARKKKLFGSKKVFLWQKALSSLLLNLTAGFAFTDRIPERNVLLVNANIKPDTKSILCRCNCLCQHGWKGELKVLLFPYLFFYYFVYFFALRNFHSGELSSQHPKTDPCGGTFLRRQGFLAVQPLTFSKMGRRNEKMCPWKKKHFLQLGFIALTQSERELSSLLKRALTEAGLALNWSFRNWQECF